MVKDHNTEQKIFEAARKVFMQKGLAGSRMQEIADEAGINKSLLHYYFRSKEKLFEGIFNDAITRISNGLARSFELEMDVMGRIKSIIDMYIDVLNENRYLPMFVLNEMSQNPEKFSAIFSEKVEIHMKKFIMQIQQEVSQGKINPINPIHLLLNVLSLVIFPFAAAPVIAALTSKAAMEGFIPVIDISAILDERKQVVYQFIENSLIPKR